LGLKTIEEYKRDYALAAAIGDKQGMDDAHKGAEDVRAATGWSPGGEDGSQSVYIGIREKVANVVKSVNQSLTESFERGNATSVVPQLGRQIDQDFGNNATTRVSTDGGRKVADYLNQNQFGVTIPDVPGLNTASDVVTSTEMWQKISNFFGTSLNYVVFGLGALFIFRVIRRR
jgi:hypothetical protein